MIAYLQRRRTYTQEFAHTLEDYQLLVTRILVRETTAKKCWTDDPTLKELEELHNIIEDEDYRR
jgi:hypothetical protein